MNSDLCLLVTLFQHITDGTGSLLRVALKVKDGRNRLDTAYLMENVAVVRELLPAHVASVGPICAIEEIFDITAGD
jgi:hypothetical protein